MRKIKKIIKRILYFINETRFKVIKVETKKSNDAPQFYYNKFEIKKFDLNLKPNYKWVGAVNYNNTMYCINNKSTDVLKVDLDNDSISYIKTNLEPTDEFMWSGGCIYNDKIYGFLRTSNDLLCIDPQTDEVCTIDLGLKYKKEHHYGGVLVNNCIYQPPRNENHILVIDLNDYSTHKINISPKFIKYKYLSGILHNNGLIYFFPETNERVLVLDPKTEKIFFMGDVMNCMVFSAVIGKDNNIYGFSGYSKGILKINPNENKASMICQNIGIPGCYGSKLGIDGKVYGIIGNGQYIWQFDIDKQEANQIFDTFDSTLAKCAGGIVSNNGDIYMTPAFGNVLYKIEFNNKEIIPENLYKQFFDDNY